jgi:glyoxylase-like metal-dependent hydrolase (beta-lactamase superfamily II)
MSTIKVAEHTFAIDPVLWGIQGHTSIYLLVGETLALIDSGAPKAITLILKSINSLGYNPKDVTKIILSHIHFDHGSGAGELLKFMPQASVYVHYNGCKHLIDPSRLTRSAKMIFGKKVEEWYGWFAPVPKERIVPVNDGDIIDLGANYKLKVLATSGHAKHGICLYDPASGGLFVGDEAGVYFPEIPAIIPASPPPDFDPAHNIETIKRLQALRPKQLFFAHYLTTKLADETLRAYIDLLNSWKKIVEDALNERIGFDAIVNSLKINLAKVLKDIERHEALHSWIMDYHIPACASGYIHYFKKINFRQK